jgi:hypothetical protein
MTLIRIPSTGPLDWKPLLASPSHWREDHSAMAAAQSWEAAQGLPPEIAAILGPGSELLLALPEHRVPLPGGARDSQCDIFALTRTAGRTCAVAVEAKVNEPFGQTIGDWNPDSTQGRRIRMDAICALLGPTQHPPAALRYQLFHRAAAAVIEAQRFKTDDAAMIVQSFAQDHRWYDDFAAFAAYLGLNPEAGTALRHPLPDGRALTLGWAKGEARFLRAITPITA